MSSNNECSKCHSEPKTPNKDKVLSNEFKIKKGEVLTESQIANNKLLEELKTNTKTLQDKIETTGKPDEMKRKERGNLDVKSLGNNKYSFESYGITTEFENKHFEKAVQTMPNGEYSNEVILKSGDVSLKVKIFGDYNKLIDLINQINFSLFNAKKNYQKDGPQKKEKFVLMNDGIMTLASYFHNSRTIEMTKPGFISQKGPDMINPKELIKYLNSRWDTMLLSQK